MLVRYRPSTSLLSPLFDDFLSSDLTTRVNDNAPRCDILERKDDYLILAEMPGVKKGDFKVEVEDHTLTIRGEKKIHEKKDGEKYYRVERVCGTFSRSFRLGDEIDTGNINAKYEDGVLQVSLPKAEQVLRKAVEVKIS